MEQPNDTVNSAADDNRSGISPAIIGWAITAIITSIIVITFNNSALVLGAGFFMKALAVVVGSALGLTGALLGDGIRKFAHPDAVYTTGGMFSLVWTKLFWMWGPQVIGLIVGVLLGSALVLR